MQQNTQLKFAVIKATGQKIEIIDWTAIAGMIRVYSAYILDTDMRVSVLASEILPYELY